MSLDEDRPHSHRRRNRIVSGLIAAGSVLAVTAAVLVWTRGVRAADDEPAEVISVSSVAITRTDLSTSRSLDGKLGYGTPRTIKSAREGVVTWLPDGGRPSTAASRCTRSTTSRSRCSSARRRSTARSTAAT